MPVDEIKKEKIVEIDENGTFDDIIELMDEDGNTQEYVICDYFYYNGEEYAVLMEKPANGNAIDLGNGDDAVIMKVTVFEEAGEEMEEFVAVDDDIEDAVKEIMLRRFTGEDELDNEG